MTQPEPVTKFVIERSPQNRYRIYAAPKHAGGIKTIDGAKGLLWYNMFCCFLMLYDPRYSPADIERAIEEAWEEVGG